MYTNIPQESERSFVYQPIDVDIWWFTQEFLFDHENQILFVHILVRVVLITEIKETSA